jgi:hypothetical protein
MVRKMLFNASELFNIVATSNEKKKLLFAKPLFVVDINDNEVDKKGEAERRERPT